MCSGLNVRTCVVAYAGLDLEVKQSGKWKGQTKLSKRGSGRLRRILYMAAVRSIRLKDSAFGAYYHRLVARGMKGGEAMIAVMRHRRTTAHDHVKRWSEDTAGELPGKGRAKRWPVRRGPIYDSVGKFCPDKRTRRKKNLLEEYERHEKQFESHFLLDEDADFRLSCFFRSFYSI